MNIPASTRPKLTAAALAVVLFFGFSMFHNLESHSAGDIAFRACALAFTAFLAFYGVFGNPRLQLLWGWWLALMALVLAVACILVVRGLALIWVLGAASAALVGSYLLLIDPSIKDFRKNLRKRP